jgi:hypothetical protein
MIAKLAESSDSAAQELAVHKSARIWGFAILAGFLLASRAPAFVGAAS